MPQLERLSTLIREHNDILQDTVYNPLGAEAYGGQGETLGKVDDAMVEPGSGQIRFLVLKVGSWFTNKLVVVPVNLARIEEGGIHFDSLTKEQLRDMPEFQDDEPLWVEDAAPQVPRPAVTSQDEGSLGSDTHRTGAAGYAATVGGDSNVPQRLQLLQERLIVHKERQRAGSVEIGKHVETRTETLEVPVRHEEVEITRHTVNQPVTGAPAELGSQRIQLDLEAERLQVRKQAFVAEEIELSKRSVTEQQTFTEQVGREVLDVRENGDLRVRTAEDTAASAPRTTTSPAAQRTDTHPEVYMTERTNDQVRPLYAADEQTTVIKEVRTQPENNRSKILYPLGASVLAGLAYALGRRQEHEATPQHALAQHVSNLGRSLSGAGSAVISRAAESGSALGEVAKNVTQGAVKTVAKLPEAVSSSVETTSARPRAMEFPLPAMPKLLNTQSEDHMSDKIKNAAREAAQEARRAAREVPRTAEVRSFVKQEVQELEKQLDRQLDKQLERQQKSFEMQQKNYEQLLKQSAQRHEEVLEDLGKQLSNLKVDVRMKEGGGFPWKLLLLGGAGYYLYRNPALLERAMGYLRKLSPNAAENLQNAGEAAREGLQSVQRGENPGPAVKNALSETQQAAQKAVSNVQDKAQDLKNNAQDQAQQGGQGSAPAGQSPQQAGVPPVDPASRQSGMTGAQPKGPQDQAQQSQGAPATPSNMTGRMGNQTTGNQKGDKNNRR
ncbi:PRC and DUF2382 domain-containing protein [Deinococcus peraridilitoris]|uniref:Conserved domain protein, TIGR02271+C111 n=1 Tax=Deinococcus peraridilitoris (strain DSM 19664 / LMG 22246 / CIP 109416 / KR-200) TaxID=937777 RepID=K9ZXC2_DEIPD|nr:PRC and DUF2382 domain-containing protein [Deinococcus peraridilitoris]AFZ66303.1 conserved domain protein, TIGR02271+C111 [Deinococcus peraridilitoris DSM 19664]